MKEDAIEARTKGDSTEGLQLGYCPIKGRTVIATRRFHKGEHVVNYSGEIISKSEALIRETLYDESPDPIGSYMLYFNHIPKCNTRMKVPLW